jgi:hypothetical protein
MGRFDALGLGPFSPTDNDGTTIGLIFGWVVDHENHVGVQDNSSRGRHRPVRQGEGKMDRQGEEKGKNRG